MLWHDRSQGSAPVRGHQLASLSVYCRPSLGDFLPRRALTCDAAVEEGKALTAAAIGSSRPWR